MSDDADRDATAAVPGRWVPAGEAVVPVRSAPAPTAVNRDGATWPLGTAADVAWIAAGTTIGPTITSAVPPVFDAYATVVLPENAATEQERHDAAVLSVLRRHSTGQRWWLGYLETGADDVVFPDAPRVILYSGWPYVLVLAGPAQAASWRTWAAGSFWSGRLPNLMFPEDRSWLVSTLWDDVWTCVGGPSALVDDLLHDAELRARSRPVPLGVDATPPGYRAS